MSGCFNISKILKCNISKLKENNMIILVDEKSGKIQYSLMTSK